MASKGLLAIGLAAWALSACGGEVSGGRSADTPSPPPAGSPAMTTAESAPPEPQSRPGLGTEWGEARESHVHDVSFTRVHPDEPFALAQLFYNDRPGIEAQAAFHPGERAFHDILVWSRPGSGGAGDLPSVGGAITVSLRNGWGSPLEAMHLGNRTYVIGQEGERYSVVIANHTPKRFEAVATVDGLDVINGSAGTFENRGYVIMPWASLEIDGFRQSEDAVAAFRFAKVRDSYAAQRGADRNVGVIGVAFFAEEGDNWLTWDTWRRETASPFPTDPRFAPPPR